jgi:hypothetical protein
MGLLANSNKTTPNGKPTSWWNSKEGKYGAWGLFIIAVGAIIGLNAILPWLKTFLTNAIHVGFLLAFIGAIGFLLTRERTRSMIWYQYQMFMRWVSNGFVKKNYLKIMRAYITSLNDRLAGIESSIRELAQQKGKLEKEAEKYREELESDFSKGKTARAKSNDPNLSQEERDEWATEARTLAERIGTNSNTIKNRQVMIDRLEMMFKVVRRMNGYAKTLKARIEHQVTVKEEEFKSISAAHKAFTNAWGIAYGQDDRRELFNMSMEHVTNLTGQKIGDMDMMMEDFKEVMRHQDLESAVFEEAGFKALEEWERKHSPKMDEDLAFLDPNVTVDQLLDMKTPVATPVRISTPDRAVTIEPAKSSSKYLR